MADQIPIRALKSHASFVRLTVISVVIPTLSWPESLDQIRFQLAQIDSLAEVIIVTSGSATLPELPLFPAEKLLTCEQPGRGYAMEKGVQVASGETVLFLHDDTFLPNGWELYVEHFMRDPAVAGGAFLLRMDPEPPLLGMLCRFSNWATEKTHEFWGDHALFVRRRLVSPPSSVLSVPIMEDVRLSQLMRNTGKTVLIPEFVTSSSEKFLHNGVLWQSLKLVAFRLFYEMGVSPDLIFRWYYGSRPPDRR